ncbi:acetyltransferase [Fusarium oxysporum]|nr:acetyltransferase [Fusarium oxysporum]
MASTASQLRNKKWTRDSFLISTNVSLITIADLNAAFASKEVYWTKSLPERVTAEMLQNSLCFALFDLKGNSVEAGEKLLSTKALGEIHGSKSTPAFTGFARAITDYVTFAFITDVWVCPNRQGGGLGKWLVGCVQEVIESMNYLRRSMLLASNWERSVPFYKELLKMEVIGGDPGQKQLAVMEMKGRGSIRNY